MTDVQPNTSEPHSDGVRPFAGVACDFCRSVVHPGTRFHRLNIAMNEDGVAARPDASAVEEETEIIACDGCEPRVSKLVDELLTELWQMMDE